MQRDWISFWASHDEGASLAEADVTAPILKEEWRRYFKAIAIDETGCSLLDIACGKGEVAAIARAVLGPAPTITCVDYALSAIEAIPADAKVDHALVADAADLPFQDAEFNLIFSLYGIEYAGENAFIEAARVTAPGGRVRLVTHLREGAIWRDCEANRRTASGILESGVFGASDETFRVMAQIRRGEVQPDSLSVPLVEVKKTVPALQAAIAVAPAGSSARALGERLYTDFSRIFGRITAYEPQDILNWSAAMKGEIEAYRSRMTAMLDAALDEAAVANLSAKMTEAGLDMAQTEQIISDGDAIAWVLEGSRS
ncbi:class I SAM-dependent methyltransferase [Parvularcula marina]|uniref:class I SAM-dependent methyltransferase n=1 Tax=Parvularcula marina TaxID=2292771 RepID=UPI0035148A33